MWQTLVNAWRTPDLRKKLLFTLMVVVIYRFGSVVLTVPYVDLESVRLLFDSYTANGNLLGYLNILTGGALSNATIFAMSITPYINSSIIIQLLTIAIPALEKMAKEDGEEGKKKIAAITRYATIALAMIQAFTFYILLKNQGFLLRTDLWSALVIILSFTAGSAIMMWLGEKVTEKGVGNGISIILFVSIIARMPALIQGIWSYAVLGVWQAIAMILFVLVALAMIVFIIYVNDAERRIPVQYAKRMVGRKMYGGQATNLPIKVNLSGVLPVIFASTILMLPGTIIQFMNPQEGTWLYSLGMFFGTESWFYIIMYALLIIGFAYFYSAIQFNPIEVANNLKKNGGFVMGYRPGKPTSDFINKILGKVTFIGAIFLVLIAVGPILIGKFSGMSTVTLSGTSILIMVGVALETVQQIEAQLMMRHYKGFLE